MGGFSIYLFRRKLLNLGSDDLGAMLSLALYIAPASPQNTALTPNQPTGTDPRSRHPDPSGVSWADHPETTLRSQSGRGDLQPAAKSHSGDTPTGTSGWRDSNRKRLDVAPTTGSGGSGPDHSSGATYMCTDINFEDSDLAVHNFGGPDFCCTVCNDNTEICCPSKDASGNPTIVKVPHDEAAYKFNLCDPDVTDHGGSYFR